MNKLLLVLILVVIVVAVAVLKKFSGSRTPKYVIRPLMTANEREFFGRLRRALPDLYVFPQLAMSAIIKPVDSYNKNREAYWKINKKIVDFSVYSKSMEFICIIELDDKMHDLAKDAERDRYTASAGVHTLRWQSKGKPSEEVIRAAVQQIMMPPERTAKVA